MKETFQIPTPETLEALTGKELYDLWTSLRQLIEQKYNMEQMWNHGGKKMDLRIQISQRRKNSMCPIRQRTNDWVHGYFR